MFRLQASISNAELMADFTSAADTITVEVVALVAITQIGSWRIDTQLAT